MCTVYKQLQLLVNKYRLPGNFFRLSKGDFVIEKYAL